MPPPATHPSGVGFAETKAPVQFAGLANAALDDAGSAVAAVAPGHEGIVAAGSGWTSHGVRLDAIDTSRGCVFGSARAFFVAPSRAP